MTTPTNQGHTPAEAIAAAGRDRTKPTRAEAIAAAGATLAASDLACEQMTPREQAVAAWTPTSRHTVEELEELIRARRGLPPVRRKRST